MKSFDEWFKKRHAKTGTYEDALCGKDDATYLRHEMRKSFNAGQQSKQDEIDELKREMLNKTNEAYADGQRSMRKMMKSNEDELQKRIDKVETLISTWNSEHDELQRCRDSNANCLSICIDELSEALKGDQS